MCRIVIIAAWCLAITMAATTQKPHHSHGTHATREPSEFDNFRFMYESHSHEMLVVNSHVCYIFTLSDAERASVHTDAGIRAIELKLLSSLSTATLTDITKDQLDSHVAHFCGKAQHYYTASV